MASYEVAYIWMMLNEDGPQPFKYRTVPDVGGQAISGINSKYYPDQFAAINAMAPGERGPAVEAFYLAEFWNKWFDQIVSDEVAKRVLDAAVNMGPGTAVRLLQAALNDCGALGLTVDGAWGPHTVGETNQADSVNLVAAFKACRCQHYQDIADNDPSKEQYLAGWLARADK